MISVLIVLGGLGPKGMISVVEPQTSSIHTHIQPFILHFVPKVSH